MKRKIYTSLLAALLLTTSITQIGCGNAQTLERVGLVAVQLAIGFESEINAIEASGLIKDAAKLANLKQKAQALKASTNALNSFLLGLKEVNEKDKAQITTKVSEALSIITNLLQNPDVLAFPEDSSIVKFLRYGSITFQQVALIIAALKPPSGAGTASAGQPKGIPVSSIKIELPEPPPEVKKHLR